MRNPSRSKEACATHCLLLVNPSPEPCGALRPIAPGHALLEPPRSTARSVRDRRNFLNCCRSGKLRHSCAFPLDGDAAKPQCFLVAWKCAPEVRGGSCGRERIGASHEADPASVRVVLGRSPRLLPPIATFSRRMALCPTLWPFRPQRRTNRICVQSTRSTEGTRAAAKYGADGQGRSAGAWGGQR